MKQQSTSCPPKVPSYKRVLDGRVYSADEWRRTTRGRCPLFPAEFTDLRCQIAPFYYLAPTHSLDESVSRMRGVLPFKLLKAISAYRQPRSFKIDRKIKHIDVTQSTLLHRSIKTSYILSLNIVLPYL